MGRSGLNPAARAFVPPGSSAKLQQVMHVDACHAPLIAPAVKLALDRSLHLAERLPGVSCARQQRSSATGNVLLPISGPGVAAGDLVAVPEPPTQHLGRPPHCARHASARFCWVATVCIGCRPARVQLHDVVLVLASPAWRTVHDAQPRAGSRPVSVPAS